MSAAVFHCKIAIVGYGPTGPHALAELINCREPLSITIFDKGERAGAGMPCSRIASNRLMLADIASVEVPPLQCSGAPNVWVKIGGSASIY